MKKNIFLALICTLLGISSTMAVEPYAVFTYNDSTLAFYNDDLKNSRPGITFELNSGSNAPDWKVLEGVVAHAVFDPTFADVRPNSTYYWFYNMSKLVSITGLENLNTRNVTTMQSMFKNCAKLTSLDLSHFVTDKVIIMYAMFDGCEKLTSIDLSSFNTEKVVDMSMMFSGCKNLTSLSLSSFNTSRVTGMSGMFQGCYKLTKLDLGSFNTKSVTNMKWMFNACSALTTIYVSEEWSTENVTESEKMFYSCYKLKGGAGTTYCSHVDASYAHIDGGTDNPGYLTGVQPVVAYDASTKTLTFYCDGEAHSGDVGPLPNYNTSQPWWVQDTNVSANVQKVVFHPSFAHVHPTSGYYWFAGMSNLTSFEGLKYFNTDEMVNMQSMFRDCSKLTSLDLSSFNTSKVTSMYCMFMGCSALTSLDLSHFDTSKVTSMGEMFSGCSNLTQLNVTNFFTQSVTSMLGMFRNCSKLTKLNLSSFDSGKVTDMTAMFNGCSALVTINVSDSWSTAAVTESNYMFRNCTSIRGGAGTTFDDSHIDKTYARVDGGPSSSTPGYFTFSYPNRFKYEGIWYDNGVVIAPQQGDDYTGEVVIPAKFTYNGRTYNVTHIEAGAFTGTSVTRVDLPGSISWIETDAFRDATKLKTLVIQYASSPSYVNYEQDFTNGNASNFYCYVRNRFIDTYENTYSNIRFASWVQISEDYYTELHPYRPFSCKYLTLLPSGLEAYYVKGYDASTRTAQTQRAFGVLPVNTGFLLKGSENKIYLLPRMAGPAEEITDVNYLVPYKTGDPKPWEIQDENARFYFSVYDNKWTSTVDLANYSSYLCIPKSLLGNDLTSPVLLDLEGSGPAGLKGDVNGDGRVNVSDVSALINMILGLEPMNESRADVNGDGRVNVSDVTALINIILGIS